MVNRNWTDSYLHSGGDDEHMTAFANYSMGPVTFGYQVVKH